MFQLRELRSDVAFAQLLLDGLHLLAQDEFALALVQLAANARLDLRLHLEHFDLVRDEFIDDGEPLVDVQLFEHGVAFLGADVEVGSDEVSEGGGVAEIANSGRQLLGKRL